MVFLKRPPLYVSVSDACTLLGVSRSTVERRVKDGTFPARKLGTRVLIERKALESFGDPIAAEPAEVQ
jgi:excisionase family DNA binding protein